MQVNFAGSKYDDQSFLFYFPAMPVVFRHKIAGVLLQARDRGGNPHLAATNKRMLTNTIANPKIAPMIALMMLHFMASADLALASSVMPAMTKLSTLDAQMMA